MEDQNPQISPTSPTQPQNIPIGQNPQDSSPLPKTPSINYLKTIGVGMSIVSFCIAIAVIGYVVVLSKNTTKQTACTMEAKLCPNGTSVGRTGPKCEFAACPTPTPTIDPTANWKTFKSETFRLSFKYPEKLYDAPVETQGQLDMKGEKLLIISPKKGINDGNLHEISIRMDPISGGSPTIIEIKKTIDLLRTSTNSAVLEARTSIGGLTGYTILPGSPAYTTIYTKQITVVGSENVFEINVYPSEDKESLDKTLPVYDQILSTFKFTDITPAPTCMQRPTCLDATPRCMIAEPASGWCPK